MGKQKNMWYTGTIGKTTFYVMNDIGYARSKSSLSGKRVKTSPVFKKTMDFARKLGEASTLASALYKTVPARQQSIGLFRKITGMVITSFKKGNTEEEVRKEVEREVAWMVKKRQRRK